MRLFCAGSIPLVLTVALSAITLSACAGGPSRGGPGGPSGAGNPRGGAPLFISPFGEAFMGEPGGAWPVAEWFADADEDADDALTFAEFEADGLRWFAHLDRDADGRIGYSELSAYEQGISGLRGAGRNGPPQGAPAGGPGGQPPRRNITDPASSAVQDGPGGRPGGGGGRPGRGQERRSGANQGYGRIADAGFFNLPQPVKGADFNIDQQVTTEEWAQATSRWFLALDTDRDGKLTLATLPQTPLQRAMTERAPIFSVGRR